MAIGPRGRADYPGGPLRYYPEHARRGFHSSDGAAAAAWASTQKIAVATSGNFHPHDGAAMAA